MLEKTDIFKEQLLLVIGWIFALYYLSTREHKFSVSVKTDVHQRPAGLTGLKQGSGSNYKILSPKLAPEIYD